MDFIKLFTLLGSLFLSVVGLVYILKNYLLFSQLIQVIPNKSKIIDFIFMVFLSGISFIIIFSINKTFDNITVVSVNNIFNSLLKIPEEFIIAFGEEFFIRVLVFIGLLKLYDNKWVALVISSLIFSLLHNSESGLSIISFFVAGIMYGMAFLRFENIWAPVGLHFGWNYFQGTIFGFPISGNVGVSYFVLEITGSNILNGGDAGPEISILGLILRFFILAFILFFNRNRNKNPNFLNIISD